MSLLNSVLGGLLGGNSQSSPMGGILGSLLGGGQQGGGIGGMLGGLMGGGQQQPQGGMGGLGDLIGRFQQAGMGGVANSWVGPGENQQVSPQQVEQVFGPQQIDQWSQQSNMPRGDLLSQLSQYLPQAVDKMTPDGRLPEGQGGSAFDKAGVNL